MRTRGKQTLTLRALIPAAAWMAAFLCAVPSTASFDFFVEDFSTTALMDPLHTGAIWDTASAVLTVYDYMNRSGGFDTPGETHRVARSGDELYVADGSAGLRVLDISDPANPQPIGSFDTPGEAFDVVVDGDFAYVADGSAGLRVLDVSDPATPVSLIAQVIAGTALSLTQVGDFLYVGTDVAVVAVFIADPAIPLVFGSAGVAGGAKAIEYRGDRLFVAAGASGLHILDCSNPASPSLLGSAASAGFASDVAIDGRTLLIADGLGGARTFDLSDPNNPAFLAAFAPGDSIVGVAVRGNTAYAAAGNALIYFDLTDPSAPVEVARIASTSPLSSVLLAGSEGFFGAGVSGVECYSLGFRAAPAPPLVASDPGIGRRDVVVRGDLAYVAASEDGVLVYDVSDPPNPVVVGFYDTPGTAYNVEVDGDYVYVADFDSLLVLDFSNPASPTQVGSLGLPATGLHHSGNYVYVAGDSSFQVVDVTIAGSPTLIASVATPGTAYCIDVQGDYAFVTVFLYGLFVYDVSEPATPDSVGFHALTPFDIVVDGNLAFATNNYSLAILDITDPTDPASFAEGYYGFLTYGYGLHADGDLLFSATSRGVRSLDLTDTLYTVVQFAATGSESKVDFDGSVVYSAAFDRGLRVHGFLERDFDATRDSAQSLPFAAPPDTIVGVLLDDYRDEAVGWEISADGGASWTLVADNGTRTRLDQPGVDLLWRARFETEAARIGKPHVDSVRIEIHTRFATIDSLRDEPGDQGGWARVYFTRSGLDFTGETDEPIQEYVVYRSGTGQPATWDSVAAFYPAQNQNYAVSVPTVGDSGATIPFSYYYVSTRTKTLGVFYDSPIDSAYSVDNVLPGVPQSLHAAYLPGETQLAWGPPRSGAESYRVYRWVAAGSPGGESWQLVAETTALLWAETISHGWRYDYAVSSVRAGGAESPRATPSAMTGSRSLQSPNSVVLHPNAPNPFGPWTAVRFDVPAGGADVRLSVYDVRGALVRTLVNEFRKGGVHAAEWDGRTDNGRKADSGVYLLRIESGNLVHSKRMILLR